MQICINSIHWVQCSGSVTFDTDPGPRIRTVPLDYGSGSCSFLQWLSKYIHTSLQR
jgi:hypothetical protein